MEPLPRTPRITKSFCIGIIRTLGARSSGVDFFSQLDTDGTHTSVGSRLDDVRSLLSCLGLGKENKKGAMPAHVSRPFGRDVTSVASTTLELNPSVAVPKPIAFVLNIFFRSPPFPLLNTPAALMWPFKCADAALPPVKSDHHRALSSPGTSCSCRDSAAAARGSAGRRRRGT